jgi:hypothetical protein
MDFLQQYASAIQAFSAIATVLLTLALVIVTVLYVRTTRRILAVSSKQARADFQPQLLPAIKYKWIDGVAKGDISLTNVGKHYFKIIRFALDFYCSLSEQTSMEPCEFQLLAHRAVVAGDTVSVFFEWDPKGDKIFHMQHDGACHWIATIELVVEDLFGFGRHQYSYDESLGLSYIQPYETTWWRRQRSIWNNRLVRLRWESKALLKKARW